MKKNLIIFPLILVIVFGFFCSCGSASFESAYQTFVYGKNYSIPYKDKSAKFVSSDEAVCKIENNQIVPISGGYSVITANDNASMVAFITGITHPTLNVKITTDSAKSYHNTAKITLGVKMLIENNGNKPLTLSRTNCTNFEIVRDGKSCTSMRCNLETDTSEITDDIVIGIGESKEVIVHFLYDKVPTSITLDKKCFNVLFLGLTVGGQVITEQVYS